MRRQGGAGSFERGKCKDLQAENLLNDIKNLITVREPYEDSIYTERRRGWARWTMKDKVSLSIFPIPHVKDYPSIPPQSWYLQWWLVRASRTIFPALFRWRGRGGGEATTTRSIFLHRLSVADASRRCLQILAWHFLNAPHSDRVERKSKENFQVAAFIADFSRHNLVSDDARDFPNITLFN